MPDNPLIFIIADYGHSDPAFSEVRQVISNYLPNATLENVHAHPFSTTNTGFWAYQLATNHRELKNLIRSGSERKTYLYINTAPRRDDLSPRNGNCGERLVHAKLSAEYSSMEILGTLSGESFSFLKPAIEELQEIKIRNLGSQFRSRDQFPFYLHMVLNDTIVARTEMLDPKIIPDPKPDRIAHIDGFGNIKLTTRASEVNLRTGETVSIGNAGINAKYSNGIFEVMDGELCVAPGSSGPRKNRFLEISLRGGSAWEIVGKPAIESMVPLKRATIGERRRIKP